MRCKDVFGKLDGFGWSLLGREGEGCFKEFEEGGLSGGTSTDDQDTGQVSFDLSLARTHGRVDLLEWCWVFPSSHPSGAVDGANRTTSIAVSAAMCHALSSSVWVNPVTISTSARWNRRDWHAASFHA